MAPSSSKAKTNNKDDAAAAAQEEDAAVTSLRVRELDIGHVSKRKPTATQHETAIPPSLRPKDLKKWNGSDIVRKGGRKTRYVFLLPAAISLTQAGGKLGVCGSLCVCQ